MDRQWSGRTGGSRWEQRSLIRLFRYMDPIWLYPLMGVWIGGYIVFGRAQRQAIWHYHRKRLHENRRQAIRGLIKNYNEFGKALLDRFACWAGRQITLTVEGQDLWDKYLMHAQPLVLLGSHVGNLEIAGYTIPMPQPVHPLVYMGESETVEANRSRLFEQMGLTIIPVQKEGGHILDMHRAIEQGHVVSIHGDRLFFYTRALHACLLGKEASFPEGCYRFAVMEQVPVLSLFVMRESRGHYRLIVKQLSDGHYTARTHKEQARELLAAYTASLESVIQRYPNQWFNFYEFWS